MHVFHYHLVTSELRGLEARYLGKLGFDLVARYGRIGDEHIAAEPGASWEMLDRDGFKLRLTEFQHGAVNVVVQPGHWRIPRVDHLGIALDEDQFHAVLERAVKWNLRVQEHGGRRTFVATNAGYRLEVHPPRDWIDDLLEARETLRLTELQLRADEPGAKAGALADLLGLEADGDAVLVGETVVRFLPDGPEGRPELYGERSRRLFGLGDSLQTYGAAGVSLRTAGAVVSRLRAAVESTGATGFGAFAGLHPWMMRACSPRRPTASAQSSCSRASGVVSATAARTWPPTASTTSPPAAPTR